MAGIRVEGLKPTVTAMQRAGVSVDDLKEGFGRIGAEVVARGKTFAPTRSERLDLSIRASKRKNAVIVSAGGFRVDYAGYVAYGSVHNPNPRPFLELAVAATDVEGLLTRAVNDALARAGL